MKTAWQRYGRIIAALVVIFVCGQGIGYAIATRLLTSGRTGSPGGGAAVADPAERARAQDEWTRRAADSLAESLTLSPEQRAAVEQVLEHKADRIWQERDRALIQIRLYLLEAHDEIMPELDASQRERLAESRNRLEHEIREQFPAIPEGVSQ